VFYFESFGTSQHKINPSQVVFANVVEWMHFWWANLSEIRILWVGKESWFIIWWLLFKKHLLPSEFSSTFPLFMIYVSNFSLIILLFYRSRVESGNSCFVLVVFDDDDLAVGCDLQDTQTPTNTHTHAHTHTHTHTHIHTPRRHAHTRT